VGAINSMYGQLKQVFSSLDKEVSELKVDKLVDQVSQLPNRQYLFAQINNWLNEPGFVGLILTKFDWLEDIHSKYGY
jgi:GGDEF domain-containing protein